ncbi:MAG: hypothetical protein ACI4PV_05535 [Butyricicoccus sp.]
MNDLNPNFIGYEYKEILVPYQFSSLYLDSYPCFGWKEDPNRSQNPGQPQHSEKVCLRFRRDRKLCNKTELTRLQRNFDGCVAEIQALERAKTSVPAIWALVIALTGTAFMAGSVFAVTAPAPKIVLSIVLAVPAFLGWILPCFVYRSLVRKRTLRLTPLIEEKYNEIYEICEKGSHLLF